MNKNEAVITTKNVLNGKSIKWAFHYLEDNMWGFYDDDEIIDETDYRVISIEEIINIESSLTNIIETMPYGYYAERKQGKWYIKKINENLSTDGN